MSKWHSTAISFKCYYLTENIARLINSNYHQQLKAHQVCLYWLFVFNCEHKHVFYSILMQMDRCWHIQHFTDMLKIIVFTIPACCNKQQQSKSPQSNRVKKEQRLKKSFTRRVSSANRAIMSPMATSRSVYVERPVSWGTAAFRKKRKKKKNEINGWTSLSVKVRTRSTDSLLKRECTRAETYWGYAYRRHI